MAGTPRSDYASARSDYASTPPSTPKNPFRKIKVDITSSFRTEIYYDGKKKRKKK